MKQSTRKAATILIALVMVLSVFSYAAMSIYRGLTQQQEQQQINYVMKERLSNETKDFLISRGVTIIEVYYGDYTDSQLLYSIEGLPTEYTTPVGSVQIIVSEIYEQERNNTEVIIESMNGQEKIEIETFDDLKGPLCNLLTVVPVECLNITE